MCVNHFCIHVKQKIDVYKNALPCGYLIGPKTLSMPSEWPCCCPLQAVPPFW